MKNRLIIKRAIFGSRSHTESSMSDLFRGVSNLNLCKIYSGGNLQMIKGKKIVAKLVN